MKRENIFFTIVLGVTAILALLVVQPFISYILFAGILTYALYPVYGILNSRVNHPGISSGILILLTLVVMILPAIFLVTQLFYQVTGAYNTFQMDSVKRFGNTLNSISGGFVNFEELIDTLVVQIRSAMLGILPGFLGSVTEVALGLFVMFFVMFYAFREGAGFLAHVKELLPLDAQLKDNLYSQIRTVTQAVLYGQVMTAIIQGSLGGLGLFIFGVPNWLFWGSVMLLLSFLPFFGTPIIWGPAVADKLLSGEIGRGVGLLLYSAIIVMNVDNFVRPRLVSVKTQVHPILILLGVIGGLKIFGFIGMVLGPLILALLVALVQFYEQAYLRK